MSVLAAMLQKGGLEIKARCGKMVSDNYVWRGHTLWIAIETIAPVLLIESGGGAPAVDNGGVGGGIGGGWVW